MAFIVGERGVRPVEQGARQRGGFGANLRQGGHRLLIPIAISTTSDVVAWLGVAGPIGPAPFGQRRFDGRVVDRFPIPSDGGLPSIGHVPAEPVFPVADRQAVRGPELPRLPRVGLGMEVLRGGVLDLFEADDEPLRGIPVGREVLGRHNQRAVLCLGRPPCGVGQHGGKAAGGIVIGDPIAAGAAAGDGVGGQHTVLGDPGLDAIPQPIPGERGVLVIAVGVGQRPSEQGGIAHGLLGQPVHLDGALPAVSRGFGEHGHGGGEAGILHAGLGDSDAVGVGERGVRLAARREAEGDGQEGEEGGGVHRGAIWDGQPARACIFLPCLKPYC